MWTKAKCRPNKVPLYLKLVVAACGGAWCFGSVSGLFKIISMVLSPGGVDFLIDSYGLMIPTLFISFHLCLSVIQLQKLLAVLPASSLPGIRRTLLLQVPLPTHSAYILGARERSGHFFFNRLSILKECDGRGISGIRGSAYIRSGRVRGMGAAWS
jgi:hypothetical protein